MNRETKRRLQRQGQLGPGGEPVAPTRRDRPAPAPRQERKRTGPRVFLREVRGELRKVAWPTRGDVLNYSSIVLVTLVVVITLIFLLDFLFAKAVLFLFER